MFNRLVDKAMQEIVDSQDRVFLDYINRKLENSMPEENYQIPEAAVRKSELTLNMIKFDDPKSYKKLFGRAGRTFRFKIGYEGADLSVMVAELPDYNLKVRGETLGTLSDLCEKINATVFGIWREGNSKLSAHLELVDG